MRQEGVRGYNGKFIDSENEWFIHFFDDPNCYIYGLFDCVNKPGKDELVSVLIAENMTNNGCMLWYLATHKDHHHKGFGDRLLSFFEQMVKMDGIKWIYLTASLNSLGFYRKMGYETSEYSTVVEHVKNL